MTHDTADATTDARADRPTDASSSRCTPDGPRRGVSIAILAGGVALAAGIVAGGATVIGMRADARDLPAPAPVTPVATFEAVRASGHPVTRAYAARLEPARASDLAFETGGTLVEVLVDEGDVVDRGDVVARLDARELEAERDGLLAARRALDADAELARLRLERQGRLREHGFAPDESLDDARLAVDRVAAGIAEADAALALVAVRLDKTALRAPFDATVGTRTLDEGATASPGQAVLGLDERAAPRLRVGLPPARARVLDRERTYRFVSIAGGAPLELAARLVSVRADVDLRTRTVSATFEPQDDATGATGATGALPLVGELLELRLEERVDADVHEVPLSALVEAERGLWSVLALDAAPGDVRDGPDAAAAADDVDVDDDDDRPDAGSAVVRRVPVRIVHFAGDRAWIEAPLGKRATLVAGGRHRVVPGMRVRPLGADELAGADLPGAARPAER